MPNTYFQFKQFIVHQDQCAMKVCTDACVLGAWFANKAPEHGSILDIGAGTGLLILMLAQKSNAIISGIEIDVNAYQQFKANIENSPWKERLNPFLGDVKEFNFSEKFDFIISNPPFFENDLQSEIKEKNTAKHSKELSLKDLMVAIDNNLKPSGSFGILLPHHRSLYFEEMAKEKNYFLKEKLLLRQSPKHGFFRSILHFTKTKENSPNIFELMINDADRNPTSEFIELMKEYYLNL